MCWFFKSKRTAKASYSLHSDGGCSFHDSCSSIITNENIKHAEKIYINEYDIFIESFHAESSDLDKYMFNKVVNDKDFLFKKAEKYIEDIVDYSKPIFDGGLILNAIYIKGMSERSYHIEFECYFKKDECMYWCITYNFPLMKADKESIDKATYWPIEFKRRVE